MRGWGTFASGAEYAGYLGAGFVFAVAALLHGRAWPLVIIPLLAVGITFSSVRATLVLGFLAIAVMLGMRSSRPRIALPAIAVVGVFAYLAAAPVLADISSGTGSDLVSHQLEGVARPFDEDSSTLGIHLELIANGITEGLRHPLGQGVALSDLTSGELNEAGLGSEFDFSDMFVRFGLPGGVIFLALAVVALVVAGRHYLRTRDPLFLGALGLAVVTSGTGSKVASTRCIPCSG